MEFYKMNGLGNDYIYFDCVNNDHDIDRIIKNVSKLSDRNFGIGSDGVVLLLPSDKEADLRMRMFNCHDGSEAEMCGNAIRCVAQLAYKLGIANSDQKIETIPGIVEAEIIGGEDHLVKVKMFYPPKVATGSEHVISEGDEFEFTRVDIGNPHAIIKTFNVKSFEVQKYGEPIENNLKLFPERTNVEFYEEVSEGVVSMRVWERGSGETLACGTGACATAAAYRETMIDKLDEITVKMLGGDLTLIWNEEGFYMQGPTSFVFKGEIDLNNF